MTRPRTTSVFAPCAACADTRTLRKDAAMLRTARTNRSGGEQAAMGGSIYDSTNAYRGGAGPSSDLGSGSSLKPLLLDENSRIAMPLRAVRDAVEPRSTSGRLKIPNV